MKCILILCGILVLPAVVGVSSLQEAEDSGAPPGPAETQDTSAIVRRVYEGPLVDFWGTCPSPDGRYVTQTDWDTGDLAVLDLLTGQKRRVTAKGDAGWAKSYAYPEAACFSPDGQRIAYVWYTEPGLFEFRVINTDGSDSRLVARPGFDPENPPPSYIDDFEWYPDLHGWSPDGEHILATLYYADGGETTLISVADGSKEVLYVSEGPTFAALSPDGRFLAYDDDEEADIFVRPVSGGDAVRVAGGPSTDRLVGWTEDGNVLFYSDRELTEGVWRVPMREGRPAGDATLVAGDLWGMWPMGVAGNTLVYGIQTEAPRLFVVRLDLTRNTLAGTPYPVEQQMRASFFPAWSPDGSTLLYWVRAVRGGGAGFRLILRSMAGEETRDVTPESLRNRGGRIQWSEDGSRVLVHAEERESDKLGFFAYTLATGEIEYVFSLDEITGMGPGVQDVQWVMFSHDWETVYVAVEEHTDGPVSVLGIDLPTGDRRTMLTHPGLPSGGWFIEPMWPSPDDRFLAFLEVAESDTALMLRVMSADGGEPRTLLTVPWASRDASYRNCVQDPLWTSDERHILSILPASLPQGDPLPLNSCGIYKVPVEGGNPIFLGTIPDDQGPWALSPDDSRLVFSTGERRGEIWILQGLEGR